MGLCICQIIVKDGNKELGKGLLGTMCKDLGITPQDLE
jgi:hypothetical protein